MKRFTMIVALAALTVAMLFTSAGTAQAAEKLSPEQAVAMAFSIPEAKLSPAEAVRVAFADCSCDTGCGCPTGACPAACLATDPVDADHTCSVCGNYANVVSRQVGSMHSHVCNHAGTRHAGEPAVEWWHPNPGATNFAKPVTVARYVSAAPIPALDVAPTASPTAGPVIRYGIAGTGDGCPAGGCPTVGQRFGSGASYSYSYNEAGGARFGARIGSGDGPIRKIVTAPVRLLKRLFGRGAGAGGCG